MIQQITSRQSILWQATLATATIIGSYALACVFPFAAFAALAALTLGTTAGIGLVITAWLANQLVGFFILSFPWEAQAVGHGLAILAATLAGYGAARLIARLGNLNVVLKSVLALGSAFVTYEALLWAYAQFGGGAENFTADIIGQVAANDALWFVGLSALSILIAKAPVQSRKIAI